MLTLAALDSDELDEGPSNSDGTLDEEGVDDKVNSSLGIVVGCTCCVIRSEGAIDDTKDGVADEGDRKSVV